ncbi:MAG: hypothetical protein ChlgKO_05820 [Chlamydiales bacterium]
MISGISRYAGPIVEKLEPFGYAATTIVAVNLIQRLGYIFNSNYPGNTLSFELKKNIVPLSCLAATMYSRKVGSVVCLIYCVYGAFQSGLTQTPTKK